MAKDRRPTKSDAAAQTLSTAPVKPKQIGVRLTASLSDRLEAQARAEGNPLSSVVRRLLAAALADGDEAA